MEVRCSKIIVLFKTMFLTILIQYFNAQKCELGAHSATKLKRRNRLCFATAQGWTSLAKDGCVLQGHTLTAKDTVQDLTRLRETDTHMPCTFNSSMAQP